MSPHPKGTAAPPRRKVPFRPFKVFFEEAGGITRFAGRVFKEAVGPPYEVNEVAKQSWEMGIKSLLLVSVTAYIIGLVLSIQSRPALVDFGATSYLPKMASISIIREFGPLVTALVCAGNIGSSISAELGSMKVTEQIDAMEVSGTNPIKFLAVTRIIACTLMLPVLVIFADFIAMIGSYTGANIKDTVSLSLFTRRVLETVSYSDLFPSIGKSFLFGFAIGLVGCYKGFTSPKGTEGVGRSANLAVVISLLLVILLDMITVQISSIFNLL